MQTLGIIPARGGSKGLPGKNIRRLGTKPLIAWTIEAALESRVLNRVIVSTDDQEIASVALKFGAEVPFMRPPDISRDDTPTIPVLCHVIDLLSFDGTVVVLQPTSPLRTSADIREALVLFERTGKTVIGITETKIHPSWMLEIDGNGALVSQSSMASQRQDGAKRYIPNGALYITSAKNIRLGTSFFEDAVGFVMPPQKSIDIDTAYDFQIASMLVGYAELEQIAATY